MDCSLELFDVRGNLPLHTGDSIAFTRPMQARERFDQLRQLAESGDPDCEFVLGLQFDGLLTEMACIPADCFKDVTGKFPQTHGYYQSRNTTVPTVAEQRNLRLVLNMLNKKFPERGFKDDSVVDELVIEASAVRGNFSRCSNCNLPMYVDSPEDHRCYRCNREDLCSYCMTAHQCTG